MGRRPQNAFLLNSYTPFKIQVLAQLWDNTGGPKGLLIYEQQLDEAPKEEDIPAIGLFMFEKYKSPQELEEVARIVGFCTSPLGHGEFKVEYKAPREPEVYFMAIVKVREEATISIPKLEALLTSEIPAFRAFAKEKDIAELPYQNRMGKQKNDKKI